MYCVKARPPSYRVVRRTRFVPKTPCLWGVVWGCGWKLAMNLDPVWSVGHDTDCMNIMIPCDLHHTISLWTLQALRPNYAQKKKTCNFTFTSVISDFWLIEAVSKKSCGKFQRFQFDRWRPRRDSKHEAFVLAEYSTGAFRQRRQSQTEKLLQKQKRQEREKKKREKEKKKGEYLKWKRQSWKPKNDQHFCYFQLSRRRKSDWVHRNQ